jgi:hypothetical protein
MILGDGVTRSSAARRRVALMRTSLDVAEGSQDDIAGVGSRVHFALKAGGKPTSLAGRDDKHLRNFGIMEVWH